MITEDYVSFETAKLLKEKGFDEACHTFYDSGHRHILKFVQNGLRNNAGVVANNGIYVAPTLQMVTKWLREIHNIHIEVNLSFSEDPIKYPPFYYAYILDSKSGNSVIDRAARIDGLNPLADADNVPRNFNTYEEACEVTIKYCLENLI